MTLYGKGGSSAFWARNDERLRELWPTNGARWIATELGAVSRYAVIGRANRLGLAAKKVGVKKKFYEPRKRTVRAKKPCRHDIAVISARIKAAAPVLPLPPAPFSDLEIPQSQRCDIMSLTGSTCRWPVGYPSDPDFFFCGGKSVEGLPYCGHHSRIAYRPDRRNVRQ